MIAYKKIVTVEDPERIVLSGLPFRRGQKVEVVMIAEEDMTGPQSEELRRLLRGARELPVLQAISEDQIAEQIAEYQPESAGAEKGDAVMNIAEYVVSDPDVMLGKPVIRGTRITVELILEKLAAGETVSQIVAAQPRLTPEAVSAALAFAAESMKADVAHPLRHAV